MSEHKIILEGDRVLLRPWKKNKADAKELYRYAKDPAIGPAAGWPVHRDPENSLEIIRNVLSTPDIYAVVFKETGRPIGCAGITYGSTGRKYLKETEGEIGYWLGVPYWGRGLIPEAVRLLLHRAFYDLNMTAVWCAYYDGNERSRRVQEKCGFLYDHTEENVPVTLLHEERTEHFTRLTRQRYMQLQGKS